MTKRELERYFWLQHEIKQQRRRLARLEKKRQGEDDIVGDSVNNYNYGRPRPLKIEGIEQESIMLPVRIKILKEKIAENIEESERVVVEIEDYIQSLPDPKLRELFRSRFIDCMKWEDVGASNFISPDYARQVINKHIKNNK